MIDGPRNRELVVVHDVDPASCWPEPAYLSWRDLATGVETPLAYLTPEWRETYPWTFTILPNGDVIAQSAEAIWRVADDGTKRKLAP